MAQGSTYIERPTNMDQIDLQTDKQHMENHPRSTKVDMARGGTSDMGMVLLSPHWTPW